MVKMAWSVRGRAKKWLRIVVEKKIILKEMICCLPHLYMYSYRDYIPPQLLGHHWLRATCIEYHCM
jgi:hypothetical protein